MRLDTTMQAKTEFYVAYDYGMGGAWAIAMASSADEVKRLSPELQVVEERPDWMTGDIYTSLQRFNVDDEATYPVWIRSLIADHSTD